MRRMVLLVSLAVASHAAGSEPAPMTFDDIVARAAPDSAVLARAAELARLQRELAASGRYTREGPTLDAELGPRRTEDGSRKVESSARIEVPFLSGRRTRADADARLREVGPAVLAAEAVASRLRLRTAYLDAWLAQERLTVIDAQVRTIDQLVASVRRRVEGGAEAPYEAALVEGELLRSRSESDRARAALGESWAALIALAVLPAEPQALASPGLPELSVPDDAAPRFGAGLALRAAAQRGSLETAFLGLEQAQRRSRWSAAATIAKEADESFATLGAAYRFPHRGEDAAIARERAATGAAIDRGASVEAARLATRFRTALERAKQFGPVTSPDTFDDALRAVALRIELGKERPSAALPVRRQLLEARAAALERVRDGHLLIAEIEALIAGESP